MIFSHCNHLLQFRQKLWLTAKSLLRRTILQKLMIPFKTNSLGESKFQNDFRQGVISARIDCTMRTFKCIAEHNHKNYMSGEHFQLDNLEFLPSLLSILNRANSVPSFHVSFKTFALLYNYLNIRDINDREQCLGRIGTSPTSPKILRVLGVLQRSDDDNSMYYCIGFDGSVPYDTRRSTLFRSNCQWDQENRLHNSPSFSSPW